MTLELKDAIHFWISVFQALLTPVIGITTAYIAVQQFRLARDKRRHDLYDRRSKLFKAVMEFVSHVAREGTAEREELLRLLRETSEAKFLFGKEIQEFIDTLYKKGVEVGHLETEINSSRSTQAESYRASLAEKQAEVLKWFMQQFEVGQSLFRPYLSLHEK